MSISQDPPTGDNTLLLPGVQLTLTCTVVITEELSDEITATVKWLAQGSDIPASLTSSYAGVLATASESTSLSVQGMPSPVVVVGQACSQTHTTNSMLVVCIVSESTAAW